MLDHLFDSLPRFFATCLVLVGLFITSWDALLSMLCVLANWREAFGGRCCTMHSA